MNLVQQEQRHVGELDWCQFASKLKFGSCKEKITCSKELHNEVKE